MRTVSLVILLSFASTASSFSPIATFGQRKASLALASSESDIVTTDVGKGKTAIIAGATGYIGKSVVREAVRQGYNTVALVRDASKADNYKGFFDGAEVVECDVQNADALTKV